jgi:Glucose / Sorbosone dehydrogenase
MYSLFLLIIAILLGAQDGQAHPLCGLDLEFFESPVPRTLSFCTQYNDLTCFTTEDDAAARAAFVADAVDATCALFHKQFVCAAGDPYQAHLFNLESSTGQRTEPFLCQEFCSQYAASCPLLAIDCGSLVGDAPYCYPVELPRAGTGGLDAIIEFPGALLIDFADPGADFGYDLWADFAGTIYKSTKSNRNAPVQVFLRVEEVFNQGELGFLTFELDPDYATNGVVWAFYSVQEQGTRFNILSRFTPSNANNWRRCEIVRLEQRGWNHNGGDIEFIDRDLYLSIGDDAPQNGNGNAQDLTNLYGKVIRITPKLETFADDCDATYNDPKLNNVKTRITNNYEIRDDNPFVQTPNTRSEIYAYGFRNPWRTFQDDNGIIYAGDVGQQLWEELDIVKPGKDYGWEALEGQNCFSSDQDECTAKFADLNYEPPVYDYPHFPRDLRSGQQHTGFSLTAGHIYTGSLRPDLTNKVLLGDYANENIWAIAPTEELPWTGAELAVPAAGGVVSMRKDSSGETIVLTLSSMGYKFKARAGGGSQATRKNGVCEAGESCRTDLEDCPGKLTGPNRQKWCCVNGECDTVRFAADCPVDCDASAVIPGCGNNICDDGEDCDSCPQDCSGHESAGNGGLQFCCVGMADFEVECIGEGCTAESCLKNKKGNKNRKFLNITTPFD